MDAGRSQGSAKSGSPHGARKGRGEQQMLAALMDKRLKGHEEAVYYVLRGLGMPVTNLGSGELPTLEVSALKQPTLFAALKRLGIQRSPDGKSMVIRPHVIQDDDSVVTSRRPSQGNAAPLSAPGGGRLGRSASSPALSVVETVPRDLPEGEMEDCISGEAEGPSFSASLPFGPLSKRTKEEQYVYAAKKCMPKYATERNSYTKALSNETAVRHYKSRRAITPSDARNFEKLKGLLAHDLIAADKTDSRPTVTDGIGDAVKRLSLPKQKVPWASRLSDWEDDPMKNKPMPLHKEKVNAAAQRAHCDSMSLPKRVASGPSRGASVIMRPEGATLAGITADRHLLTRLLEQQAACAEAAVLACRGGEPLPSSGTLLPGQGASLQATLPASPLGPYDDNAAWAADAEVHLGALEHQGVSPFGGGQADTVAVGDHCHDRGLPPDLLAASADDPGMDTNLVQTAPVVREKPIGILGARKGLIGWQLARGVTPWM